MLTNKLGECTLNYFGLLKVLPVLPNVHQLYGLCLNCCRLGKEVTKRFTKVLLPLFPFINTSDCTESVLSVHRLRRGFEMYFTVCEYLFVVVFKLLSPLDAHLTFSSTQ